MQGLILYLNKNIFNKIFQTFDVVNRTSVQIFRNHFALSLLNLVFSSFSDENFRDSRCGVESDHLWNFRRHRHFGRFFRIKIYFGGFRRFFPNQGSFRPTVGIFLSAAVRLWRESSCENMQIFTSRFFTDNPACWLCI